MTTENLEKDPKGSLPKEMSYRQMLTSLIVSIFNVVVTVAAVIFILSTERTIFWIGVLLGAYILARLIYKKLKPHQ